jgi:hypothetical protein
MAERPVTDEQRSGRPKDRPLSVYSFLHFSSLFICSTPLRAFMRWLLVTQSNIREPRENRGRLRHCNGLQTPTATGHTPGRRERGQARSQDIGLPVLVLVPPCGINFSVKRRMRPARRIVFRRGSLNAFIPRLAESEGFLFCGRNRLQPVKWRRIIPIFSLPLVSQFTTLRGFTVEY